MLGSAPGWLESTARCSSPIAPGTEFVSVCPTLSPPVAPAGCSTAALCRGDEGPAVAAELSFSVVGFWTVLFATLTGVLTPKRLGMGSFPEAHRRTEERGFGVEDDF